MRIVVYDITRGHARAFEQELKDGQAEPESVLQSLAEFWKRAEPWTYLVLLN